ncbi:MAG: hypothetical protein JW797_20345 [Bradymonadales bacterium]|nr:hypothetical protein [Bradymonadales bacterium]
MEDHNDPMPHLLWEKPVWCHENPNGGLDRIQCGGFDRGDPVCLVAPGRLLVRPFGGLERVQPCARHLDDMQYLALETEGYRMVPAIAEAPPGWYRDRHGRVYQVTFDLLNRFYLGGGWVGSAEMSEGSWTVDRGYVEMGFSGSFLSLSRRSRHTVTAVEGRLALADLETEGRLVAYDYSHLGIQPAFFIATFFGTPRRYDVFLDLGFGVRLFGVHLNPHHGTDLLWVEYGEAHGALDIWQSQDLYNHVRLAAGLGVEGLYGLGDVGFQGVRLAPGVQAEARFALDRAGHHYANGMGYWALPILLDEEHLGDLALRGGGEASYEVILFTIDNQPVSLHAGASLSYRDDLPVGVDPWEARFLAGLRFSLWAPPRVESQLPRPSVR